MPSIDRYAVFSVFECVDAADHNIFFDAADQSAFSFFLSFNDQMMLPHGNCTVAIGIHGNRFQFDVGMLMDYVYQFSGGEKAIHTIGHFLCSDGCEGHAGPIFF